MRAVLTHSCLVLLLTGSLTSQAQISAKVNCTFPESWNGRQVMLVVKPLQEPLFFDTTTVYNQHATFSVNVAEPCPAYVWAEGSKNDIDFFLDSPAITITVDSTRFDKPTISGSPSYKLWAYQDSVLSQFGKQEDNLRNNAIEAYSTGDSLTAKRYHQTADSIRTTSPKLAAKLIRDNPQSSASWYLFASNYFSLPISQALQLLSELSSFASMPSYQRIKEKLARKQVGIEAPDFTLPLPSGEPFTLSKLKSKYVLITFCESHDDTCRQLQAALTKLYGRYHSAGLEIVSVSLAFDKQTWQKTVANERLPWFQVMGLAEASVWEDYAVERWPDNVLLNSKKVVIGRTTSVDKIKAKLEQLEAHK